MSMIAAAYARDVRLEIPLWMMLAVPIVAAAIAAVVIVWFRRRQSRQDRP
jgi:hypothetical protein